MTQDVHSSRGTYRSEFRSGAPEYCPYCDEKLAVPEELDEPLARPIIWRRHRRVHFDWADVSEEIEGKYLSGGGSTQSQLPREAQVDTQQYEVVFHDEYRERVVVEAASQSEASELAQHERTYDG